MTPPPMASPTSHSSALAFARRNQAIGRRSRSSCARSSGPKECYPWAQMKINI